MERVNIIRVRDPLQAAHAGTPHRGRHHRGSDDRNVDIRHFAIHRLAGASTTQGNIRLTGRKRKKFDSKAEGSRGAHRARADRGQDETRTARRDGAGQRTQRHETAARAAYRDGLKRKEEKEEGSF